MKNLSLLIFVLLFLLFFDTYAQLDVLHRYELNAEKSETNFNIIIKNDDNPVITYISNDKVSDKKTRHFKALDKEFNLISENSYEYSIDYDNYHWTTKGDSIFCFQFDEKIGEFLFTITNLNDLVTTEYNGVLTKKLIVKKLAFINEKIFLAYRGKNDDFYSIRIYNTSGKLISDVKADQILKYNDINLHSSGKYSHTKGDEYHLNYTWKDKKNYYGLLVFRYSENGDLINNKPIKVNIGNGKEIFSITNIKNPDGKEYLISGTYSDDDKGFADGLFTGIINENEEVENYETHNFLELPHFVDFLEEKHQQKIEKKKQRKQEKGKELKYNGMVKLHSFYTKEDKNYLVYEFYHPTYRYEYNYSQGKNVRVFDGYQNTHALLTSIRNNGTIEWTNVFKMWTEQKFGNSKKLISTSVNSDNYIELSYADNGKMNFITFDETGNILQEKTTESIESNDENDKVKFTTNSNIQHWYDNFYIISGQQKLKEKEAKNSSSIKQTREVQFFNVVKY